MHKVSLIIGTSSQLHDDVHLKFSTRTFKVFLRHFSRCHRKAFYEGYDKINELSNFECHLITRFNKLRHTSSELGLKDNFF